MIARFGWKKLQAAETVSPQQLEANYMRRSDAEMFVKRTSSSLASSLNRNKPLLSQNSLDPPRHFRRYSRHDCAGARLHYRRPLDRGAISRCVRPQRRQRLVLAAETLPSAASDEANAEATGIEARSLQGFMVAQHVAAEWELENIVVAPRPAAKGLGRSCWTHCWPPPAKPAAVRVSRSPRVERRGAKSL